MNWFISNHPYFHKTDNSITYSSSIVSGNTKPQKPFIFIDGYVVPRLKISKDYRSCSEKVLIKKLYDIYGFNFINYVKGSFTIIIFIGNEFFLFTDHHNLKKYFIYREKNNFIISNSIKTIAEAVELEVSHEKAALYILLKHYIYDNTLFKNVCCSKPASILTYNKGLTINNYWAPAEFFIKPEKWNHIKNIAITWKDLISDYVDYLKPEAISLTLTGGNDSRMVLAGLLSNGIKPFTFTFGNPDSSDGIIASEVAQKVSLTHNNYFVNKPDKDWFTNQVEKIIKNGNSLVNIHRAHRLDAIEKEKSLHPESEMLFTGLVGGEYIKEPDYNNITLPKIIDFFNTTSDYKKKTEKITSELQALGVNTDLIDIKEVYSKLQSLVDLAKGYSSKQKKFIYTYHFYAVGHHTQDPKVFSMQIPRVVNPFIDIDFMESLASSKSWYINKKSFGMEKLWHSFFLVKITDVLFNPLSSIPFAKKGAYSGNDMLHKPFAYFFKRFSYLLFPEKNTYPQNFPIGKWLYEFTSDQLKEVHPAIKKMFYENFLEEKLEKVKNYTTEEKWHPITLPINLSLNLQYYVKI